VCEREDANRTREAGNLDEIQGVGANSLKLYRQGAVGFIDWLDVQMLFCPQNLISGEFPSVVLSLHRRIAAR